MCEISGVQPFHVLWAKLQTTEITCSYNDSPSNRRRLALLCGVLIPFKSAVCVLQFDIWNFIITAAYVIPKSFLITRASVNGKPESENATVFLAKRGVMVPGVSCVDCGNWGWDYDSSCYQCSGLMRWLFVIPLIRCFGSWPSPRLVQQNTLLITKYPHAEMPSWV